MSLSDFGCRHCRLVGSSGLEPPTSRLSGARSNHLSYEPIKLFRCISSLSPYFASLNFIRVWPRQLAAGGDDGIRTHDPLLAGQVLSQLSYTPILFWGFILSVPPFVSGVDPVGRSLKIEQQASHTSHLYLTWPLVCRDFALLKTTKSRKPCLQISCSP